MPVGDSPTGTSHKQIARKTAVAYNDSRPNLAPLLVHGSQNRLSAKLFSPLHFCILTLNLSYFDFPANWFKPECAPRRSRALTTAGVFGRDWTWSITYVSK